MGNFFSNFSLSISATVLVFSDLSFFSKTFFGSTEGATFFAKKVAPSVEPKKVLEKKDKSEKTKTVAEIDREKLEKKFPKKKEEKLN